MVETAVAQSVSQSYGRCLGQKGFLQRFYDIFLASSPDLAPMFVNTDFEKQVELLRASIAYAITYAENPENSIAKQKLEAVGETHSIGKINVKPELYPFWINSLVQTVSEFDPKFSPDIEANWRTAVQPTIDLLKSKYQ